MMVGKTVLISILAFSLSGRPQRSPDPRTANQAITPLAIIEKAKGERTAGNFAQAAELFKEAEKLSGALNQQRDRAFCLMSLGMTSWDLGDIRESSRYLSEAAALYHNQGESQSEDLCRKGLEIIRLYNLGKQNHSQGRDGESLDCYDKAIGLGRQTGIEGFELKCLRLQSLAYWEMGNVGMFFTCNKRALEIARRVNHRREIGRCLNNIGVYYGKIGDYSQALRNFETSMNNASTAGDSMTEAEASSNLGGIYLELDYVPRAITILERALTVDKQNGREEQIAKDLNNLGIAHQKNAQMGANPNSLQLALQYFRECQKVAKKNNDREVPIQALNNIGNTYYLMGDINAAAKELANGYSLANALGYKEVRSAIEINLAYIEEKKGHYQKAIAYLHKAIVLPSELSSNGSLWEAYFGLGCCYEAMKDFHTALDYFNRSIEAMEQLRRGITLDSFKISFARSKFAAYQHALDILYSFYMASPSAAHLDDIFRMIERAKAQAFLEGLIATNIANVSEDNPEMSGRERELSREIAILNKKARKPGLSPLERSESLRQLEEKEDEYMRIVSSLRADKRDSGESTPFHDTSVSDIQTSLVDGRTALLEYHISENRSYLLLVTRHNAQLYTLAGRGGLEDSLRGYLKSLISPASGSFNGVVAAERIGVELLFPLERDLPPGIDTLIIVPDGILDYLPFETLRMNAAGKANYLVESYRISYCPSSAALLLLKQKPQTSKHAKTLLAFGAPDYGQSTLPEQDAGANNREFMTDPYLGQDNSLPSLPFSKEEVLKIARHFPVRQCDLFLGKQANETTIKNLPIHDYRILHFACHGILDNQLPFRSALALSQEAGKEEDGFLQVREIYNLRMNADLVVLSACQTGDGVLERAEGLVGLTRSFFCAGARSVLSTIWAINDRTTALLMERFYSCLARGLDKSSALREAKLAMLKSPHSHPYYWAGFILNGDPAPIRFEDESTRRLN